MALGLLIAAAGTDMAGRRVPNGLIVLGMITGVYLAAAGFFEGDPAKLLWRFLWPILLLYPLYLIGGIGAGDVKLMGCLSLYLPPAEILWILTGAFLLGGIAGAVSLVKAGRLSCRCKAFLAHLFHCLSVKRISAYYPEEGTKLHFAVCIFCSAVLCFMKEEIL